MPVPSLPSENVPAPLLVLSLLAPEETLAAALPRIDSALLRC